MAAIRQVNHAIEPTKTKGWELSLYYTAGRGYRGYYLSINFYTKSSPDSPFHSISLFGAEKSRKDLLQCDRKSSKREAEAIALFDKEVSDFIAANPVKVIEAFVVNIGDRFFQKATKWHWDRDKVITIIATTQSVSYGVIDQGIESTGYNYADLVDLERLEPATQDELSDIHRRRVVKAEAIAKENKERQDLIEKGRSLVPSWAKAAIVAKLHEDQSDSQSDYFGSSVTDKRVLGFSRSDRNAFAEMRKFAAMFDGTAHLTEKEHENRENYSGGGGYYLGISRYHGWQVEKTAYALNEDDTLYALGKYGLPDAQVDDVSPQPRSHACRWSCDSPQRSASWYRGRLSYKTRTIDYRQAQVIGFSLVKG